MFNKSIFQLFPALFTVRSVFAKDWKFHELGSISFVKCVKINELLAQKDLQKFPKIN